MDDGLAEKLFEAFYFPVVPVAWKDLPDSQREAWESVAVAARAEAAAKVDGTVTMLREANAAWQRENGELRIRVGSLERSFASTGANPPASSDR